MSSQNKPVGLGKHRKHQNRARKTSKTPKSGSENIQNTKIGLGKHPKHDNNTSQALQNTYTLQNWIASSRCFGCIPGITMVFWMLSEPEFGVLDVFRARFWCFGCFPSPILVFSMFFRLGCLYCFLCFSCSRSWFCRNFCLRCIGCFNLCSIC